MLNSQMPVWVLVVVTYHLFKGCTCNALVLNIGLAKDFCIGGSVVPNRKEQVVHEYWADKRVTY